jgi:methylthioribulose-1-phosphate dehydratase
MKNSAKRGSQPVRSSPPDRRQLAATLAKFGREFHARGWALGTSGNYSVVLERDPLRLLITSSGQDKSRLKQAHFLEIDGKARLLSGQGRPSAESFLHLAVVGTLKAGCVLHTHSVWNTLLSERYASEGQVIISGYEMLKGLEGVATHEHRERIPVFSNDQDLPALAAKVQSALTLLPALHGFLLGGHGLYTWGENVAQARRHVEIFEFLFEVLGRKEFAALQTASS